MLEFNMRNEGKNIGIIELTGSIDLDGALALKEKISEVRKKGSIIILINCKNVSSVSSAHLQQLLSPIRALVSIRGMIAFTDMTEHVHKFIKTAMFYPIIKVYATEMDALAELSEQKHENPNP